MHIYLHLKRDFFLPTTVYYHFIDGSWLVLSTTKVSNHFHLAHYTVNLADRSSYTRYYDDYNNTTCIDSSVTIIKVYNAFQVFTTTYGPVHNAIPTFSPLDLCILLMIHHQIMQIVQLSFIYDYLYMRLQCMYVCIVPVMYSLLVVATNFTN